VFYVSTNRWPLRHAEQRADEGADSPRQIASESNPDDGSDATSVPRCIPSNIFVPAYEAWLVLRPAIEIPLIIGKWFDDRENVSVWKNRNSKRKPYRERFWGDKLRSKALADSDRIQSALSRLNDLFAHPNPDYCNRHINAQSVPPKMVTVRIEYFDDDEVVKVAWLAMSHLMVFVQDRLWKAIASTLVGIPVIKSRLDPVENQFAKDAATVASKSDADRATLEQLGLWEIPRNVRGTSS